jgi:hypothetical protein
MGVEYRNTPMVAKDAKAAYVIGKLPSELQSYARALVGLSPVSWWPTA